MSFSERTVLAELLTSLTVIALFCWYVVSQYAAGAYDGADWAMVWARHVLWMIPAGIVIAIAVSILFALVWRAVTGEDPDELIDERDRLIASFGWKVNAIAAAVGFFAALVWLASGGSVFATLNLMLAAFAACDVVSSLAKLLRYRFGS